MEYIFQIISSWEWFNEDDRYTYMLWFLPVTILATYIAIRLGLKRLKKIKYLDETDIKYFKKILRIKILIIILAIIIWLPFGLGGIIYAPFAILSAVLPLLIFERILYKKYFQKVDASLPAIKTQADLNQRVETILDSKNFLTALRSTLPRGEKDKEFGLDYIPYMLKNIEARKKDFADRARGFLITSIGMGVLFVGTTIWLGYLILDEDSIGTGRQIREIEENTRQLKEKVARISSSQNLTSEYKKIENQIREIEDLLQYFPNEPSKEEIKDQFEFFKVSHDMDSLYKGLDDIYITDNPDDQRLYHAFWDLKSAANDYIQETAYIVRNIPELLQETDFLISDTREELSKNVNRTPEIIKRLILSLVIISFFLAILKFLTNQYRKNFDQLVMAEDDDLRVRKIYIALRTAADNSDSKNLVISQLLFNSGQVRTNVAESSNDQTTLIKELIETLSKKL